MQPGKHPCVSKCSRAFKFQQAHAFSMAGPRSTYHLHFVSWHLVSCRSRDALERAVVLQLQLVLTHDVGNGNTISESAPPSRRGAGCRTGCCWCQRPPGAGTRPAQRRAHPLWCHTACLHRPAQRRTCAGAQTLVQKVHWRTERLAEPTIAAYTAR